jgi:hypothetical protein
MFLQTPFIINLTRISFHKFKVLYLPAENLPVPLLCGLTAISTANPALWHPNFHKISAGFRKYVDFYEFVHSFHLFVDKSVT